MTCATPAMCAPRCLHAQPWASQGFVAGDRDPVHAGRSGLALIRNTGVRTANTSTSGQESGVRSANTWQVVQHGPSAGPENRSLS